MASTFHTYPESITDGGRHARTDWGIPGSISANATQAVAATLRLDPEAIISRATDSTGCTLIGYLPGGLA